MSLICTTTTRAILVRKCCPTMTVLVLVVEISVSHTVPCLLMRATPSEEATASEVGMIPWGQESKRNHEHNHGQVRGDEEHNHNHDGE